MKKYKYDIWYGLCVTLSLMGLFLLSCNKAEFLPAPIGEALPYVDSTLTISQYMENDTDHSIFWLAWRKCNMEKLLSDRNQNYRFTLFLPDNAAMQSAGFDMNYVRNASRNNLDTLLRFHITPIQLDPEAVALQNGNIEVETMLLKSDYFVIEDKWHGPKPFKYDLGIIDSQLRINNRQVGSSAQSVVLKYGTIFPITKVLKKPLKSTRRLLVEDGRFKLFLGIRRYNDSLYNVLAYGQPSSVISVPYESNQYVQGGDTYDGSKWGFPPLPMLDYLSEVNNLYNSKTGEIVRSREIYLITLLAPTDEAFHRAGFHSLADLITFNHRVPLSSSYGTARCLPTDSILNHHFLGANIWASENLVYNLNQGIYYTGAFGPHVPMLYYSNELRNEWIGNPIIRYFNVTYPQQYSLIHAADPLDFIHDGDQVRIRVRGSEHAPATIIEKDIESYTGIIHVLDRLLIPKGFKIN